MTSTHQYGTGYIKNKTDTKDHGRHRHQVITERAEVTTKTKETYKKNIHVRKARTSMTS
jgi:hypothetical protein